MILQRLVEHYDRLTEDPAASVELPQIGFSREKISFEIVVNEDGTNPELNDLRIQDGKKLLPRIMAVPDRGGRSGITPKPNFLWDNSGFVLVS